MEIQRASVLEHNIHRTLIIWIDPQQSVILAEFDTAQDFSTLRFRWYCKPNSKRT
jgi:hypothetical protein